MSESPGLPPDLGYETLRLDDARAVAALARVGAANPIETLETLKQAISRASRPGMQQILTN
jgi:hypothetical protein